jgi:hypothetical protein
LYPSHMHPSLMQMGLPPVTGGRGGVMKEMAQVMMTCYLMTLNARHSEFVSTNSIEPMLNSYYVPICRHQSHPLGPYVKCIMCSISGFFPRPFAGDDLETCPKDQPSPVAFIDMSAGSRKTFQLATPRWMILF